MGNAILLPQDTYKKQGERSLQRTMKQSIRLANRKKMKRLRDVSATTKRRTSRFYPNGEVPIKTVMVRMAVGYVQYLDLMGSKDNLMESKRHFVNDAGDICSLLNR